MKLRSKTTGIIGMPYVVGRDDHITVYNIENYDEFYNYSSFAEMLTYWEEVPEEPKWSWYIDWNGEIKRCDKQVAALLKFETREKAEKAVKKIKEFQRLKDRGFRFTGWKNDTQTIYYGFGGVAWPTNELEPDLDLLFGGEE